MEAFSACWKRLDFLYVAHPVAPVRMARAVLTPALNDALIGLADEDVIHQKVIDVTPVTVKLLVGEGNLHTYFDPYLPCFGAYCHDDSPWKVCYTNGLLSTT